jgi:hypothetical protein
VEEEQVETNWASHDVGRLSGGQSLAIHHFQGLQVVMRHEGELGYQGHVGLEGRPFWPRLDHPLSNPVEKSSLE